MCLQIDIGDGASRLEKHRGRRDAKCPGAEHGSGANSIKTSVKRSSARGGGGRGRGRKAHRLIGCDRSGKLHRC